MSPNILIILLFVIGGLNLVVPFITRFDTRLRKFLLILVSVCFLCNIIIIDYLFVQNIQFEANLFKITDWSIDIHIEALGIIFLNLIALLWIFTLIYATCYLDFNDIPKQVNFLFFLNLSVLIGVLIALSANLFTMLIFYELLTIATIPLISHQIGRKTSYKSDKHIELGVYRYLKILMTTSTLFFLPAVIIIYSKLTHGNFILNGILEGNFSKSSTIILLLLFIFGISKTAIFPFGGWLPAAMVASYPVSALLHAVVVVKAGLFCIIKILVYTFGLKYLQSIFINFNWLIFIPIITIFHSAFSAIKTNKIKMILAYSTINQLSISLMAAFLLTKQGIVAAVIHMVAHSFTKISLFYAAGNIYSLKKSLRINDLYGISKIMPITSIVMVLSVLSLIGFPPLACFVSKFYIMKAASTGHELLVLFTVALSSIFSAIYLSKLLTIFYRQTNDNQEYLVETNLEKTLPTSMLIVTIFCSICVVLFIIFEKFIAYYLKCI